MTDSEFKELELQELHTRNLIHEDMIAKLKAENDALREKMSKQSASRMRCKVSEKRAVSVYGLSKQWPVTLYPNQWQALLQYGPEILEFMQDHRDELSWGKES